MTTVPEPHTGAAATAPAVPLDEVMLAMDVVDTLRHERAQIDAALNDDERQRTLIARVKEIYLSQGIEVPDEVVAEGVAALEQDRFKYVAPERTFAVRLAEIYAERGKWAKRALIAAGAAAALALAVSLPFLLRASARAATLESRREAIAEQRTALGERAAELTEQAGALRRDLGTASSGEQPGPIAAILDDAQQGLAAAEADLATPWAEKDQPFDAAAPAPEQERIDRVFARRQQLLAGVADRLGAVRGHLQAVAHLRGIDADVARALLPLAGAEVEPAARTELDALVSGARAAVANGDAVAARQRLQEIERLVAALAQSYELRIVTRPNQQSGVWRETRERPGARNHYVIVEASGPDGRPVELPITSEEDQRTHRTSTFGVRVPAEVYERVKADKLDNGIVDDAVFGHKRKGARAPAFRFAVAGGYITEW